MDTIRAGIIGLGYIGPVHLEALRRLHHVEVAIASHSPERAQENAQKFGVARSYGNWKDLVEDPEIDVVHICTPNALHYPIAKHAILFGKHVICDKPLTLDTKEAEELVELAEAAGIVNAVTFNTSFYPMVQQARVLVEQGELGTINYLQGQYLQDWLLYGTDYNWRVESKYQGRSRVVGDVGVHCLYMLQSIIGQKVTEVYADFNTFVPTRKRPLKPVATYCTIPDAECEDIIVDTEDQATMMLRFDGGTRGIFVGGQVFAGRKNRLTFEIYGAKKSLAWNSEVANSLWIGNRMSANETLMKDFNLLDPGPAGMCDFAGGLVEGFAETWKILMKNIYDAVSRRSHGGNYPTFRDGLYMQKVADAAAESAVRDRWVRVE